MRVVTLAYAGARDLDVLVSYWPPDPPPERPFEFSDHFWKRLINQTSTKRKIWSKRIFPSRKLTKKLVRLGTT